MALSYACSPFLTEDDLGMFVRCECDLQGLPLNEIIEQASDVVCLLSSGGVRGRCTETVRPCAQQSCVCGSVCCDDCRCCRIDTVPLPGVAPAITSIWVDGLPLADSDWKIINGNRLARVEGTWPDCQHLLRDSTEEGTFEIVYEHGFLPLFAKLAAAELTCLIAAEMGVSLGQELPSNWTTANLDGLTVARDRFSDDPGGAVSDVEHLGLRWCAKFLAAYGGLGNELAPCWSVEIADRFTLYKVDAGTLPAS